jgi:hypothetical protein
MNKAAIFAFIFGAAVGSAITWKIATTKYDQILQDELNNLYDELKHNSNDAKEPIEQIVRERYSEHTTEKPDLMAYKQKIKETGYTGDDTIEEEGGSDMGDKPYVISPDEYGDADGYDCESLTYYADGVLTDDWDHPIEDVEAIVGVESLEHFGDNEGDEDSVFVRNDRYKTDYEILRDNRKFSEIPKHNYTVDDE